MTVIDWVVSPVDHKFPIDSEEVKTTFPPSQNVKEPLAEIVGIAGFGFTVIVVGNEFAVHPFTSVKETA